MDPITIAIAVASALLAAWLIARRLMGYTMYGKPESVASRKDIQRVAEELLRGELEDEHFFTLKAGSDEEVVQVIGKDSPLFYLTNGDPKPTLRRMGFEEKPGVKEDTPSLKPMEMAPDEYGVWAGVEPDAKAIAKSSEEIFRRVFGVTDISDLTIYR